MKQPYNQQEDAVYFIGEDSSRRRGRLRILIFILVCILIVTGTVVINSAFFNEKLPIFQEKITETVNVLPEKSKAPLFNGKYGMAAFPEWLGKHLKYPEGYELMDAKVIVEFTVQTDGSLGQFKIISSPKEKVFQEEVLRVLRQSPRWTPARLANGQAVEVRYTIPVQFSRVRTHIKLNL